MGKMQDANAYLADTGVSAERAAVRTAEFAWPRFPPADAGGADSSAVRSRAERMPGRKREARRPGGRRAAAAGEGSPPAGAVAGK